MRTKLFLLLFMAFIPIAMLGATSYTADGVKYNLYTDGHAEVVADNYEGNVTIPNEVTYQGRKYKVTKIAASAFEGATKLTLVDLPSMLTTIGDYAFRGCTQLKAASLAEGISIGTEAFANTGMVKLQLEGSCNIGAKAFYNCKLQKVIVYGFPSSPSTIGSKAFGCDAGSDCVSSLKDFYFFSQEIGSNEGILDGRDLSKACLYVEEDNAEYYRSANPWKNFGTIKLFDAEEVDLFHSEIHLDSDNISVDGVSYLLTGGYASVWGYDKSVPPTPMW